MQQIKKFKFNQKEKLYLVKNGENVQILCNRGHHKIQLEEKHRYASKEYFCPLAFFEIRSMQPRLASSSGFLGPQHNAGIRGISLPIWLAKRHTFSLVLSLLLKHLNKQGTLDIKYLDPFTFLSFHNLKFYQCDMNVLISMYGSQRTTFGWQFCFHYKFQ